MGEKMVHPETGEELVRGVRRLTVSYKGLTEEVDVAGWYPPDPGATDGLLDGSDGDAVDAALARLKARAHAPGSGKVDAMAAGPA